METTLIRNGTLVDGTGSDTFAGDILVEGERIAAILRPGEAGGADTVIDAAGHLVTPGFIDSHAHSDAYLILEPDAPSKIAQGVTTEINGQCGGSAAPRFGEARLSSDWVSLLGDRLTWRSLAEYREAFNAAHPAVNSVQFIGHNTLRSGVVGYAPRRATNDELALMVSRMEQALEEGAWGISTGLIYQPGVHAAQEEVLLLAQKAAAKGAFYSTHMRSEGDFLLESIGEVIELAKTTGIRAQISHLKTSGRANWGKIDDALDTIEAAVDAGILLGSDRYPFCAAGTDLDIVLPAWAQAGGAPAECARLADATQRARIVAELDASSRDWSSVMIGGTWHSGTKRFSGRTISSIAAETGVSPGEAVCSILEKDLCRTGAFFFGMSEDNLDKILSKPWVLAGSDASLRAPWGPLGSDHPHPRAYATMPEFYRRLRALGFSLEETIARMTSAPARRFGIDGRGTLEKGAFADIAIWKEDEFKAAATYEKPHAFPAGVAAVLVNGALTFQNGKFTGKHRGRFLERR